MAALLGTKARPGRREGFMFNICAIKSSGFSQRREATFHQGQRVGGAAYTAKTAKSPYPALLRLEA